MLRYSTAGIGDSYADVAERLFLEFAGRLPLALITDTLGECRAQRSTSPETAMPELLERLARQRLTSSPTAVGF